MLLVRFLPICVLVLVGCSYSPGTRSEPVAVKVVVTAADGKPVKDVLLILNATTAQTFSCRIPLNAEGKGTVEAKLIPGTYAVSFEAIEGKPAEQAKYEAAFMAIPEKYHKLSDHTLTIKDAGEEKITLQ